MTKSKNKIENNQLAKYIATSMCYKQVDLNTQMLGH